MEMALALAGALSCQNDSYLKNLSTSVVSCEPSELNMAVSGNTTSKQPAFAVTLQDTVLFPEGGGQPDDRGTINGVPVLRVQRHGGQAVHYVPAPLDPGCPAEVVLDWPRRWDHMQQHSAQHLVTAVADAEFDCPTTSWNLGDRTSSIELDTASMSSDKLARLEELVNGHIRGGACMYPTVYAGVHDPRLQEVRTRGLPADHVGPVRVVTIEGIETNMCCGTHVSSLSHLQCVKLLSVEKGKKSKVNIVFIAGERVLEALARHHLAETRLTTALKGGPPEHLDLLAKLQITCKLALKSAAALLRDVAVLEAARFSAQAPRLPYFFLHRREGDNDFMNTVHTEINDKSVTVLVSTGDERGAGLLLLAGPDPVLDRVLPQLKELLEVKGAVKNGKFQGRANKLSRRLQVEKLIEEACRAHGADSDTTID